MDEYLVLKLPDVTSDTAAASRFSYGESFTLAFKSVAAADVATSFADGTVTDYYRVVYTAKYMLALQTCDTTTYPDGYAPTATADDPAQYADRYQHQVHHYVKTFVATPIGMGCTFD